jgi:hypothetical protein
LQKAIISFAMPAYLPVRTEKLGSYWKDFH